MSINAEILSVLPKQSNDEVTLFYRLLLVSEICNDQLQDNKKRKGRNGMPIKPQAFEAIMLPNEFTDILNEPDVSKQQDKLSTFIRINKADRDIEDTDMIGPRFTMNFVRAWWKTGNDSLGQQVFGLEMYHLGNPIFTTTKWQFNIAYVRDTIWIKARNFLSAITWDNVRHEARDSILELIIQGWINAVDNHDKWFSAYSKTEQQKIAFDIYERSQRIFSLFVEFANDYNPREENPMIGTFIDTSTELKRCIEINDVFQNHLETASTDDYKHVIDADHNSAYFNNDGTINLSHYV